MNKIDVIVDSQNLNFFKGKLNEIVLTFGKVALTLQDARKKRSLPANAQVHVWAKVIAEHTGEDIKTTYNRIKRDHGLPILLADKSKNQVPSYILEKTKFYKMNDHQQLMIIDAMEVTRTFTTKQHNQLRDSVQQFWADNGLNLTYRDGV